MNSANTAGAEQTKNVMRAYFDAWANGDSEGIVEIMADDCQLTTTADSFRVSGRTWPRDIIVKMVAEAYADDHGFHMYDATHGAVTIRIVEHITVQNGLVTSITASCDRESYEAFCAGK